MKPPHGAYCIPNANCERYRARACACYTVVDASEGPGIFASLHFIRLWQGQSIDSRYRCFFDAPQRPWVKAQGMAVCLCRGNANDFENVGHASNAVNTATEATKGK